MLHVLKQKAMVPSAAAATTAVAIAVPLPQPLADSYHNPRGPLWLGALVVAGAFVGLFVWAALAPLGSAAMAPGWVAVESSHRIIQHLEGGIIKEILVQDGSVVKAGDVLLRIDNTRAQAELKIRQTDLDSLQANEARLLAEQGGEPAPAFPPELLTRQADPDVASILSGQRNLFQARRTVLAGQKAILEERVAQYRQEIVGLKSLEASKREQARYIKDELNGLLGLMSEGIVTKTQVLALEREASRLEGERGEHIASIARAEQGIGETQVQSFQLDKERQEEVAKELRDVQAKLTELKQTLITATDVGHRVDITAPVAGTVMNLNYHTVGGVVAPGAAIMELIPSDDVMIVECQINPADIDTVRVNGEVALQVSAVNSRLTPVIFGVLASVSPDRITDQKTGASYYKGRITITKEQQDRLGNIQLHTGMQVSASISRGEHTVLHLVLKPLLESLERSIREK